MPIGYSPQDRWASTRAFLRILIRVIRGLFSLCYTSVMSTERKTHLTPEEYLALERKAEVRSEYLDGDMVAMSGGSREHNLIVTNIVGELRTQLKGRPCEVYPSNMRVKVSATGLYTYPDVVVVCGEPQFEDANV